MSFLNLFSGQKHIKAEKARLEAFLSAVPGEYCGFSLDGSVVYSHGFCAAMELEAVERFSDIQMMLCGDDGRAFEAAFAHLLQEGVAFDLVVQNRAQTKVFKLSGRRGEDLSGRDHFHVLWLEEVLKETSDDEAERLREALDALPYAVWIRDAEQKIIWSNVAYSKHVGLTTGEIVAQQKEIISQNRKRKPGEKEFLFGRDLACEAMHGGKVQRIEVHEVLKGKRLLLRISEMPVRGKDMCIGMAEDITHEEAARVALEDNQAANRILLEQLRAAISIYGQDQRLAFYNSSFAQLWGLEDGWLNTQPKLGEIMEKLRETRRLPEQADFRVFKKSWIDMFTSLIDSHEDMLYLPDGSAVRMLVVPHKLGGLMMNFEDVTSRLELESSYNTLIAVQKETLDNLEEGVAVYGGDGRLKLWNPAFAQMWGCEPEMLSGEPHVTKVIDRVSTFFNETDWLDIRESMISLALERSLNEGRVVRLNETVLDYSTLPLPDGGVLITYTDVTDTVRVEKALREKNIALEAAEQLKLDFLANVSYQLRTPLSAIMGFNEMMAQEFFGSLNQKQKEYTRDIHDASERLLNLINDILDLSTIEAGQMGLDIHSVSVKSMMESVMMLVTDWARQRAIEVSLVCPANIGKVEMDERRIKQAVINLVRNAIAHSPEGSEITLKVARKGDMVSISVSDQGVGIPQSEQERVLQPFERIDGSQAQRGAGLGLSLVKNIVDLHEGSFEMHSTVGQGTEVSIIVPKKQNSKQSAVA